MSSLTFLQLSYFLMNNVGCSCGQDLQWLFQGIVMNDEGVAWDVSSPETEHVLQISQFHTLCHLQLIIRQFLTLRTFLPPFSFRYYSKHLLAWITLHNQFRLFGLVVFLILSTGLSYRHYSVIASQQRHFTTCLYIWKDDVCLFCCLNLCLGFPQVPGERRHDIHPIFMRRILIRNKKMPLLACQQFAQASSVRWAGVAVFLIHGVSSDQYSL